MGPVGAPVGEPPAGSMLTAKAAVAFFTPAFSSSVVACGSRCRKGWPAK